MFGCSAPIASDIAWSELALLGGVVLVVSATSLKWRLAWGLSLGVLGIVLLGTGFLVLTGLALCYAP